MSAARCLLGFAQYAHLVVLSQCEISDLAAKKKENFYKLRKMINIIEYQRYLIRHLSSQITL